MLAAHEPFESKEAAIESESDIHSTSTIVKQVADRKMVRDTDEGKVLAEKKLGSAEEQARKILEDAIRNAESAKKESILAAKDEIYDLKKTELLVFRGL